MKQRLSMVFALPLALVVGAWIVASATRPVELERRADDIAAFFDRLLIEAQQVAETALSTADETRPPLERKSLLLQRLEGVGVLGPSLDYAGWHGSPVDPPAALCAPGSPAWLIRVDGVRTRLVTRAGPDEQGRLALASFVLDSRIESESFETLLPRELQGGVFVEVQFGGLLDTVPPATEGLTRVLVTPDGEPLATAILEPLDAGARRSRIRHRGRALGAALFALLATALFPWRRWSLEGRGVLGVLAATLLTRALLIVADVPGALLPRGLGSASAFGSSEAWGLLRSPADLLLSLGAVYVVTIALRTWLARRRTGAVWLAAAGFAVTTAALIVATLSVADNSDVALLARSGWWRPDARLLIALALVTGALAAAEIGGLVASRVFGRPLVRRRRAERVVVALMFIGLIAGASYVYQRRHESATLDRFRTELAPQVLEQTGRREVALQAAVRHVQDLYARPGDETRIHEVATEFLAYHLWVESELFHSGYRSSLALVTPQGFTGSHFEYGLPELRDLRSEGETSGLPPIAEDDLGAQRSYLHAEMPLHRDGEFIGYVVGHVLDEADNLPFLPGTEPYLAAMGPGTSRMGSDTFSGGPQYVLYDGSGTVLLTTLRQTPRRGDAILDAAEGGGSLRLQIGEQSYLGIAVPEQDRLHLLLAARQSMLERLAGVLRLAPLGLGLIALQFFGRRLLRRGGWAGLWNGLRRSFYRKLLLAVVLASIIPLVGLAYLLQETVERRGRAALIDTASQVVGSAQRILEDYALQVDPDLEADIDITDEILFWLRGVVGQEIHVYEYGRLIASSKPELFRSGLLPPWLDGDVERRLFDEGLPYEVVPSGIGLTTVPVAYAPIASTVSPGGLVVAIPLVLEQRQIAHDTDRVVETIVLATMLLAGLLAVAATVLAGNVARPVAELVEATADIAGGDYALRLESRGRDEMAELVRGFNSMAAALGAQRADLERRRDYMERLLQNATTGVLSVDARGNIVTLNPAARRLLGPELDDLRVGRPLVETLTGAAALTPLRTALEKGAPAGEAIEIDLELEGKPRRLRLVQVELPDASGGSLGRLLLLDDVTDLMRSNQLAAWAEMARAIAHEIKNPLTPIQLSTEHLQRLLRDRGVLPSEELDACIDTVIKQVRNLHEIAGEFSTYAKLPSLAPNPTDPVEFLRETVAPYRVAPPPGIVVDESYDPVGAAAIDTKVLRRAVINLIENAIHAMPDGGTLAVSAGPADDGHAHLSVTDTGIGLDPEVRRRLFEPYFSTKSSGTGLGLAIVRQAVEAHNGEIDVSSESGAGTTFRIRLPLVPGR